MDTFALDPVRALISRMRVAEMKSLGWRVVGPGEEGSFLMEGPELGGGPERPVQPLGSLFDDLIARALERADLIDYQTRHRTGRRAARHAA